jgi:hypothetical protein
MESSGSYLQDSAKTPPGYEKPQTELLGALGVLNFGNYKPFGAGEAVEKAATQRRQGAKNSIEFLRFCVFASLRL